MFTRRDIIIVTTTVFVAVTLATLAQNAAKPTLHSSIFNWITLKAEPTKVGERRGVFDAPTATLARLECHITTLNPGESPHAGHRHLEEELMIIKEGTIEAVLNDVTNRVETGGIIFCASNEMHGLKNIGTNRATYYVLKIYPHGLDTNRVDTATLPAK